MKTKFEELPPEKQAQVRAAVDEAVKREGFDDRQRADLEYLLGIRRDLSPMRSAEPQEPPR